MRAILLALVLLAAPVLVAPPAQATSCVDDLDGMACDVLLTTYCVLQNARDPKVALKRC